MVRESANGPVYNGAGLTILGLTVRVVPSLGGGEAIVADTSRCYAVVRSDARIEVATTTNDAWHRDGSELRIIARMAAVIPSPAQAARALTIAP